LRIIAIAAFAAVSAFAFSASAADQGQPKPDKASTAKPDDGSKIVCKGGSMGEPDTGTRLPPKKTCHTKREWDEMAAATRQDMDQQMSHNSGTTSH
jgi:hypothetical protein